MNGIMKCPACGGDGKETCNNPDHGFYGMMDFHDVGRIGCPCCGHDPKHKVPNGGECDECGGTGHLEYETALKVAKDYGFDDELEPYTTNS